MSGHGWVIPNKDGSVARCGGPGICMECSLEADQKKLEDLGAFDRPAPNLQEIAEKLYPDGTPACMGRRMAWCNGAHWGMQSARPAPALGNVEEQAERHADREWSRYHGRKEDSWPAAKFSFLAGFQSALEVGRMLGRVEACSALTDYADDLDADRIHIHAISRDEEKARTELRKLLGNE